MTTRNDTCRILVCGIRKDAIFPTSSKSSDYRSFEFWVFAFLSTTSAISLNAVFTLSDTACTYKFGVLYGRMRVWGGIGWGLIASIAGYLNDFTNNYITAWTLQAIFLISNLYTISKMDMSKPKASKNILRDIGKVLSSKKFIISEILIVINGMGAGIVWNYLTVFLISIGGSRFLCGLALMAQSFMGSLPFFYLSKYIIKKVGHFNILSLALFGYSVRFLWYSYLRNPWVVLPVEAMHGITYGLLYAELAVYGKMHAKPGTEATTQSVIFGAHEGLGCGLGCLLAGVGMDELGGHQTFFYAGTVACCGLGASLLASCLLGKKERGSLNFPE